MADIDLDSMSLPELVALRDRISRVMKQRFEQPLALFFTDTVGSTDYIAARGDVAGRELLARHHELLRRAMDGTSGRIVDTAGDGAFCVADTVSDGARTLVRLQRLLLEDNAGVREPQRLRVRSGLHRGRVLVAGDHVSGEAVHVAARIAASAADAEIRLSDDAFRELTIDLRPLCRRLGAPPVKGLPRPLEILALDWRDPAVFPTEIEIVETEQLVPIPCQDRVGIGRLANHEETIANDIVLQHLDPQLTQRISRWHVELEMTPEGYRLRSTSRASTEVDGKVLTEGQSTLIRPGSKALLSGVLTLVFREDSGSARETTLDTSRD